MSGLPLIASIQHDHEFESPFGPSYYDTELVEKRLRRQVQSEIASFELINPPSDLDESCESPIPPPSDDSSDSDSYVEDTNEIDRHQPTINYGRQPTYSETSEENNIGKDMSDLLNQVRGLSYQDNRSQKSNLIQQTEYNGRRNATKSVADIAGAWMDRDSREWRGNN